MIGELAQRLDLAAGARAPPVLFDVELHPGHLALETMVAGPSVRTRDPSELDQYLGREGWSAARVLTNSAPARSR